MNLTLAQRRKREQLPTNFKDLYASQSSRMTEDIFPIFELAIKYTERETSKVFRYAVQHAMLRTSGDEKMDIWACERKLFPWVAIAAPLQVSYRPLVFCLWIANPILHSQIVAVVHLLSHNLGPLPRRSCPWAVVHYSAIANANQSTGACTWPLLHRPGSREARLY